MASWFISVVPVSLLLSSTTTKLSPDLSYVWIIKNWLTVHLWPILRMMFDSARSILNNYIDTDKVSRFTFYSIDVERGENPEDLYYLCSVKGHHYVVYETDYIVSSLSDAAREAASIFKGYDLLPLHWIVKKDSQPLVGVSTIAVYASDVDEHRKSLVSDKVSSTFTYEVRYAIIEFTDMKDHMQHRFHPNAYGSIS